MHLMLFLRCMPLKTFNPVSNFDVYMTCHLDIVNIGKIKLSKDQ